MSLKKYLRAKERHDTLQREHDRLEGALTQLMERLKAELGCDCIGDAEEQLELFEEESKEAERKYKKVEERFQQKWEKELE